MCKQKHHNSIGYKKRYHSSMCFKQNHHSLSGRKQKCHSSTCDKERYYSSICFKQSLHRISGCKQKCHGSIGYKERSHSLISFKQNHHSLLRCKQKRHSFSRSQEKGIAVWLDTNKDSTVDWSQATCDGDNVPCWCKSLAQINLWLTAHYALSLWKCHLNFWKVCAHLRLRAWLTFH